MPDGTGRGACEAEEAAPHDRGPEASTASRTARAWRWRAEERGDGALGADLIGAVEASVRASARRLSLLSRANPCF